MTPKPSPAPPHVAARLVAAGWIVQPDRINWRCPATRHVNNWPVADLLVRVPMLNAKVSAKCRPGKPSVDQATVATVRDLRARGSSFAEIGRAMGVSRSYAHQAHRRYVQGVKRKAGRVLTCDPG